MVLQSITSGRTISLSDMQYEFGSASSDWSDFRSNAGMMNTNLSDFYGLQSNMILPVLRLDANSVSHVGVGGGVSSWSNTGTWGSGYFFNLANGTAPVLGQSNNEYHVKFSGNSWLGSAGTAPNINWVNNAGVYEGLTIMAVYKSSNLNQPNGRLIHMGSCNVVDANSLLHDNLSVSGHFRVQAYIRNGQTDLTPPIMYADTYSDFNLVVHRVSVDSTGTLIETFINDESYGMAFRRSTVMLNRQLNNTNVVLGGTQTTVGYEAQYALHAEVREFLMFDKTLTKSELYSWMKYLKNRWRLTSTELIPPSIFSLDSLTLATTRGVTSEAQPIWKMSSSNGNYPWYYTCGPTTPLLKYNSSNLPYLEFAQYNNTYYYGTQNQGTITINESERGVTHFLVVNLSSTQAINGFIVTWTNSSPTSYLAQAHGIVSGISGTRMRINHRDGNGTDASSYVDGIQLNDVFAVYCLQYDYDSSTALSKTIRGYRNDGTVVSRALTVGGPGSRVYSTASNCYIGAVLDDTRSAVNNIEAGMQEYDYYDTVLSADQVWRVMEGLCAKWELMMSPVIRFDASTQTGGDGTIATTWTNSGLWGTGYTMTPVNSPLVRLVSTYKHINFVAASSQYFVASTTSTAITLNNTALQGLTIFMVARTTTNGTYTIFTGSDANDQYKVHIYTSSTNIVIRIDNATNLTTGTASNGFSAANTWYIHAFVLYPCTNTINTASKTYTMVFRYPHATTAFNSTPEAATFGSISGNVVGTAVLNRPTWSLNYTRLCSSSTSTQFFNGDVRDFLLYDYAMSSIQLRATFKALRQKWGM